MNRILLALTLFSLAWFATADPFVRVENAWVREAPPSARMLAAYMTIKNTGDKECVLATVDSPDFNHVMLHKSEVVDGVARMIHVDELPIPAHGQLELAPGGYHLMMPAPETPLTEGDRVEFVLTFCDDSTLKVQAEVQKKP
jgi:copper(I)-binding protein